MGRLLKILAQTGRNFRLTWTTQCLTMAAVGLSVLIFSFFFLIYMNLVRYGERLGDEIRLTVFLNEEVPRELKPRIEEKIREFGPVERIEFVSRREAFAKFSRQLGEERQILEDLDPDFLPPSIEVYPAKTLKDLAKIEQFSQYLATLPGVDKVQYGKAWLDRFSAFSELLWFIVLMSGALLFFCMVFLVAYTVRLTVLNRGEEIEILKLLGASEYYIKVPLIIEGTLQGALGSSLGMGALYLLFRWFTERFGALHSGFAALSGFSFFSFLAVATIIIASTLLCILVSIASIRRFLRA